MVLTAKDGRISAPPRQRQPPSGCRTATRSRRCAGSARRSSSRSRCRGCRASRAGRSASSPTTWSGTWSGCRARPHDDLGLPDAVFMFTDTLLVFDNLRHRLLVIANAHVDKRDPASLDRAYDRAAVRIGMTLAKLRAAGPRGRRRSRCPHRRPLLALGEEGFTSTMDEATFIGRGAAGEGVHRRRRRLPDRAVAPARLPRSRPIRSRSTARCGPSTRRRTSSSCAWARRRIVGSSPEVLVRRRGRSGGGAADRRHASAGRHRGARTLAIEQTMKTRSQGAGRARHAGGPRPQRRGPGGRAGLGQGDRVHGDRALLARHAPGESRDRHAQAGRATPSTCCARASRPGPSAGRRRSARWRSSTRSSRPSAAPTPARWATSRTRATSTPASPSGPSSATAAAPRSRSAPASWPTPIPRRSGWRRAPRRAA